MKQNEKGFSLIEVLIAKTILLVLLATFIPIYTTITYEQAVLKYRLAITSVLHDELQPVIWNKEHIDSYTKQINNQPVTLSFTTENEYIKGCANWVNKKNRKEEICLYGLDEK